ncbi:MAG TPA: bacteriocin [Bacteroidia bacterium]|nr:bacteriocin [Bacteroidia bacterium]
MFKKLLKSKKEVTTNAKVEKLNSNELKNVIGGGTGDVTPTPDPVDVAKVRSHSNINNN